jgi:hypothetical protein
MEEKPPRFGIFCFIDEVKIDIIGHPHPLIRPKKKYGRPSVIFSI